MPTGEASRPAPDTAPAAPAATGRVVTEHFHSDALGVDKDVVVYLPAGYDAQPTRHWPVFYYLHGLGGDETNWAGSSTASSTTPPIGSRSRRSS